MKLRDYQKDIINQVVASDKSTLIQVPTGGGKTVIAKEIISRLVKEQNLQVLFLAPKIILMEQTAEVFKDLNPDIIHGSKKYNKANKVLISTTQTASRRKINADIVRAINPNVIFVDEIHYGFEGKMLQELIKNKSNTRIVGLSATPYNKDGKQLEGFELVLDKYDLNYMVENKYLVDVKSYVLTKIANLDKLSIVRGDYNPKELTKIVSDNRTILEIVESTSEYISKYKKAIVFAVDINHAELLTKAYKNADFSTKVLHSKISKDEVNQVIADFKENKIKILVSVLMLTTGFDVPDTDVAIIARPTKSQNLYKQMVGRVLRLSENKKYALILDCANVIEDLGMPLDPIRLKESKEYDITQQRCQRCDSSKIVLKKIEEKSFWECKECGYKKPIDQGVYKCKSCSKLYTSNAKFIIKNSKLWLDCDFCEYPTLISEYTGNEKLIEVSNYLSFQKAREYVREQKFKTKKEWQKYINDELDIKIPDNIPRNPQHYYQKKGWIDIDNWLGDIQKTTKKSTKYLPFYEAREYIFKKKFQSKEEWKKYTNNLLSEKIPKNIPKEPHIEYKYNGWKNYNDWLGIKIIEDVKPKKRVGHHSDEIIDETYMQKSFNYFNKDLGHYKNLSDIKAKQTVAHYFNSLISSVENIDPKIKKQLEAIEYYFTCPTVLKISMFDVTNINKIKKLDAFIGARKTAELFKKGELYKTHDLEIVNSELKLITKLISYIKSLNTEDRTAFLKYSKTENYFQINGNKILTVAENYNPKLLRAIRTFIDEEEKHIRKIDVVDFKKFKG